MLCWLIDQDTDTLSTWKRGVKDTFLFSNAEREYKNNKYDSYPLGILITKIAEE